MNYKSGDLVKITGNCTGHRFKIGETVRLKHEEYFQRLRMWSAEHLDGHDFWNVRESDMAPVKPATMPQKIIITTDGKTTLARLFDGKTMVKRAEAKCSPSDTFDFGVGAELAVKRLMGDNPATESVKESEPEPVKLYGIKDNSGWVTKGKIYEFVDGNIRFDEFFGGKLEYESFEKFKEYNTGLSACLVPLVRRPAKVGEWVYINAAEANGNAYKNGDIMRVTCIKAGGVSASHTDGRANACRRGGTGWYLYNSEYLVLSGYTGDPA